MLNVALQVLVAAAITVAVGLLSGGEWPAFIIGAVLSLSLWVMLYAGACARPERPVQLQPLAYLTAAVVGVALGYAFYRIGDDNGVWWAVGFILAGVVLPIGAKANREGADS